MFKAELYAKVNGFQRRDSKLALEEFFPKMKFRNDGTDDLLDVGCGPGNITVDYIVPMMPANFRRIVGGDLSEGMLDYAKKTYNDPKVEFVKMDITSEEDVAAYKNDQFDHVTSFFVINLASDQKKAFKNIYDVMKPGADCIFIFLRDLILFDIFEELSKTEKFGPYMKDWKNFVSSYRFNDNILSDVEKYAKTTGFSKFNLRSADSEWCFKGVSQFKEFLSAVNPIMDRLPTDDDRADYINNFLKKMIKPDTADLDENEQIFVCPYTTIISYGVK